MENEMRKYDPTELPRLYGLLDDIASDVVNLHPEVHEKVCAARYMLAGHTDDTKMMHRYRDVLEVIRDNPRFNNGVEACHIAAEALDPGPEARGEVPLFGEI